MRASWISVACFCWTGFAANMCLAEPDWRVAIELNDGSRVVGEPLFESVQFLIRNPGESPDSEVSDEADIPLARLRTDDWVIHTGQQKSNTQILTETLSVTTLIGKVDVPVDLVVGLEVFPAKIDVDLPARKDLVLYLNFDRNAGPRARNLASFRHQAEVRRARWTTEGRYGGAYEFDGDAQLVIPHHAELCPDAYTLAAWVFPNDPKGPWRLVMSKTKPSFYGGYGFSRYSKDNSNLYFYVGDYTRSTVKQAIPQRQWVHVAGVCDGRKVQLFVNGEPAPPLPLTRKMKHTETPFIVGGFGGYNWIGKVDVVALFRRALTDREIRQLMLAGSQTEE